ncbi:M23 family metallopeptidase [Actimicrobium sp. CCI2.3]|uniref:M23 family metallopeptidase n=1 Tax=Actimicrobium sp. CCI2.3 TaxID=3048616 RepID=UPI002AB39767|nr:M23 family metallopeptidase [Actimicrobium sp. CCI2.3]MDY7573554.1 M23 family metallopeptidase [Actimicrobium sp. CCI2.3]MEB0022067.1 M23 family metallopeptidase [Actimicrobium sp. CCI2.3]
MQIILLHPRFTQARSVTLTLRHGLLAIALLVVLVLGATAAMTWLTLTHAINMYSPSVQKLLDAGNQGEVARNDRYVRENIAAMAIKLGEMQAQLMRLDALGERVQGLSGVKPEEFNFKELPGRGGAAPPNARVAPPLGISQFQQALDALVVDIEHRSDYMNAVESTLMFDKIRSKLLPTIQPVNVSYNASGFGWRMDPFTGRSTFHEGIDFPAPTGTAIIAAAGGVVIAAEFHSQFGNMLEIDHGNDIVTRYAHASRLLMKVGDIVQRGQHVADIGTTGRSTGAHLHFEVLVKGVQQDPHKFLIAGAGQAAVPQVTRK